MTFIKMASYTIQQHVQIVELFYKNQRSVKSVFTENDVSFTVYIKFHLKALSVEDQKTEKYSRSNRLQEYIDLVRESVVEDSEVYIRRRSQKVGLLHKEVSVIPFLGLEFFYMFLNRTHRF